MLLKINGIDYQINADECAKIPHDKFNFLVIRDSVGTLERIVSLINEIGHLNIETLIVHNTTHGGFIPINCSPNFQKVIALDMQSDHADNAANNIKNRKIKNITFDSDIQQVANNAIVYSENDAVLDMDFIKETKPVLLTLYSDALALSGVYKEIYRLTNSNLVLYIPDAISDAFNAEFSYFITKTGELAYDNLNHLCIMVKNGGPQFEQMLLDNMHFFDRWTILDTGSTDETLDIINRVLVGKMKGNLYQEPFINFKESRNRCLDLAGDSCKFLTMLDDTYVIKGDLRGFLNEVRGDQMSTSFTLYINSDDTTYGSNRIIKSKSGLRYIHRIHEVITDKDNVNIVIPREVSLIDDRRFDYMEKRTMDRKQLDLKLLFEEVEENPHDPRAYYYLAQTYNLLEDYENATKWFLKRTTTNLVGTWSPSSKSEKVTRVHLINLLFSLYSFFKLII